MDPKLKDVFTSVLAGVGSVLVYMGVYDAPGWTAIAGGIMTVAAVLWPWFFPSEPA